MGCGASEENNKGTSNPSTISNVSGSPNKNERTLDGKQLSPINRENISNNSVVPSQGNNPLNIVPGYPPKSNPLHINTSKGAEDEEAVIEQPGKQRKRKNSTELKEKEFERSILKESDLEPPRPNLEAISSPQQAGLQLSDKPPLPRSTLKPLNINAAKLDSSLSSGTSKDSLSLAPKKTSPRASSGSRFLPPIRREPIRFEAVPQGFDLDLEMENEGGKNKSKVDTKQLVDELLRDMEEL
jgi:hypothetical protein